MEDPQITSTRKLTVGFKCDAALKQKLTKVSNELGFTVSEFIETLLGNYTDLDRYITENRSDAEKNKRLTAQLDEVETKLAFYENPKMKRFLTRLIGQDFRFIDYDGNQVELHVTTIQDVFTLMITSFKIHDSIC
jgi:antitoxin component of RelBE/YafQ-DinJ toxin-antitoxin module